MVRLMHAITDSLNQIGCHLAGFQGKDHVCGHSEISKLCVRHTVLDQLLIEDSSLDSYWKTVEVLDLRKLACVNRRGGHRSTEEEKNCKERK